MRAVVFANGVLNHPESALQTIAVDDFLIAADGGLRHCLRLGLKPDVLIGDFDSVQQEQVDALAGAGTKLIRHPSRKDFTDLELALLLARDRGSKEIIVLGALGARWDQTLANLLLPATQALSGLRISLFDGPQEMLLVRGGGEVALYGAPGDTVSLIPIGGDATGVTTKDLEYPLERETLTFGATRGVSNVLLKERAVVRLDDGMLVCVVIHRGFEEE